MSALSTNTAMSSTLDRSQKLQNCFRRENFFKLLKNISVMFYLEMSGDFEYSELGHIKNLPAYALIIFVRLVMDRLNCLQSKIATEFRGNDFLFFYQSTLVQKLAFLNSEQRILSLLPVFEIVHHILIVVNVLKRWKPSTELIRMFVANNSLNWSIGCRQLQHFFSHYKSLKNVPN